MSALLSVLRAAHADGAALEAATASVDPRQLAAEAALHGLAGLTRRLVATSAAAFPELADAATREAAAVLAIRDCTERVLRALAEAGIAPAPVLLKGYGFSSRYYPEPLLRFTRDVDLLVAQAQLEATIAALSPIAPIRGGRRHGAVELRGPSASVDLHLAPLEAFGLSLPAAPLLARAVEAELLGQPVRYLAREDELLYLSLHASNHLLQRIAWLYDLLLLCEDPALDWDAFLERIPDVEVGQLAWFALDAAHRLLGARIPARVLSALAPSQFRRAVASRALTAASLAAQRLWGRRIRWAMLKAALAPGPVALVRWTVQEAAERVARPHRRG